MAVDDDAEGFSDPGREALRVGNVDGVTGPESCRMLARSLAASRRCRVGFSLGGGMMSAGGRSIELTRPISSMASPRRLERSVIVDELTRRGGGTDEDSTRGGLYAAGGDMVSGLGTAGRGSDFDLGETEMKDPTKGDPGPMLGDRLGSGDLKVRTQLVIDD